MENKRAERKLIRAILSGRTSKRVHAIFLLVTFVIFLFGVIYAQIVFPGRYSILNNWISDQGGIRNNPSGHMLFNICLIVAGSMLTNHFIWVYRRLLPTKSFLAKSHMFTGIIGCFGIVLVGIFPQDFELPHNIAGVLAFGGFYLSALFMFAIQLNKFTTKDSWGPKWVVFGFYPIYLIWIVTASLFVLRHNIEGFSYNQPLFSGHLWQWSMLAMTFLWLLSLYVFAPNSLKNNH